MSEWKKFRDFTGLLVAPDCRVIVRKAPGATHFVWSVEQRTGGKWRETSWGHARHSTEAKQAGEAAATSGRTP